jgi:hypothetical protein
MNAPADIEPALAAAVDRAARQLAEVAEAIARLELLLQLIASAAVVK